MSKTYDATLKYLVALQPSAWLKIAGLPADGAEVLEDTDVLDLLSADLSTVTAAADILMRLRDGGLAHIEFQTGADSRKDDRTLRYNILADYRYQQQVESAVILLRREADHPGIKGRVQRNRRSGARYLDFSYSVVRIWEIPVEHVLAGPLGVLPVAPLMDLSETTLPEVIRSMGARIRRESAPADAEEIWTSVFLLMGMRYPAELALSLLKGVMGMEESTTYQFILKEGEARGEALGIRNTILRIGSKRFGAPTPEALATFEAIDSAAPLQAIADRLLEVESWQELLGQG